MSGSRSRAPQGSGTARTSLQGRGQPWASCTVNRPPSHLSQRVPRLTGALGDPVAPLGRARVPAVAGEHGRPLQAVPGQTSVLDMGANREAGIRGGAVPIGDLTRVGTSHDCWQEGKVRGSWGLQRSPRS